ncbi:MAG: response regulator transcription factor [Rhodoferax sp.]|nr:response regulator transcription factor [Rhodoferax sp.]
MITQHLFLASDARPAGERWQQAFPLGKAISPSSLPTLLPTQTDHPLLVWASSEDPQWRSLLALARQVPGEVRLIVLSNAPHPAQGLQALHAGARGYTHAHALPELLREVATVVEHGGLWAGPDLLQKLVACTTAALHSLPGLGNAPGNAPGLVLQGYASAWATLSRREMQVALRVAEGKSNKEVARLLLISERTIKAHLSSIFEKLGVRDRLQLALLVGSLRLDDGRGLQQVVVA